MGHTDQHFHRDKWKAVWFRDKIRDKPGTNSQDAAWLRYKSVHMFIFNSTESLRDKSGTCPGQIRDNFRRPPRGLFALEAPSFRIRHMHTRTSHAHTQLRLARTHDTNETKATSTSISRLGSLKLVPQPPTYNILVLACHFGSNMGSEHENQSWIESL